MAYRWGDDWILAQQLAAEGKYADEIAAVVGRSHHAVRKRFELKGVPLRHRRRGPAPDTTYKPTIHHARVCVVPDEVESERLARYEAAARRTQTQEFFGDPPPGFSWLDRKRQSEGAQS